MNFNYSIISEFLSFLTFFIFSYFFIYPLLIVNINNFNIENFKNKVYLNYNKTLYNKFIFELKKLEFFFKENIFFHCNNLCDELSKKKNIFLDMIISEKNYFLKYFKNKIFLKYNFYIKNKFFDIKKVIVKSFKNVYNELINYNNEFIVNNEKNFF